MARRDPRLQDGRSFTKLLNIVCEARPDAEEAMKIAERVPVPAAEIDQKNGRRAWEDVIRVSDREGSFQTLLDILDEEFRDGLAARSLKAWLRIIPLQNMGAVITRIQDDLDAVTTTEDLPSVEFELRALCETLASLTRTLARPEIPDEAFGGLRDSPRLAQRARDTARQALAAAHGLLYQVQGASGFLLREATGTNSRDEADLYAAQGVLIQHVLRDRSEVDRAVTALLGALHAIWPGAFAPDKVDQ